LWLFKEPSSAWDGLGAFISMTYYSNLPQVLSLHPKPSISVSHLQQLCTEQVSKASDWMPWEQLHWKTEHLQLTTQVTQQQQLHSTVIILPEL
jgi:hypothetical protein